MNRIVKPVIFDYNTNKQLIEELIKEYPFLKVDICGRTVLGRGIFSFSFGSMHNSVIIAGGFEGDDELSPLLLYMFIEDICKSIKERCDLCGVNIKRALSQLGITIIPSVNPDGREINLYKAESAKSLRRFVSTISSEDYSKWKSNAKGVDIRRNFGADFDLCKQKASENGIVSPSHRDFCGDYPESELETKALTRLCRVRSFRQCLSVSFGEESLLCANDNANFPESDLMSKIIAQGCFYPIFQKENDNICGFPQWFSKEFSKPAFELKAGRHDSTYRDAEEIYERVKEAFTVFSLM